MNNSPFNVFGGAFGKKAKKLSDVTFVSTDTSKIVTTDSKKILTVKKGV